MAKKIIICADGEWSYHLAMIRHLKAQEISMRLYKLAAALTLSLVLAGTGFAQTNVDQTQMTQKQLKQQHKADKAQAKADKAERKAMRTKQQKKADKAQDKANREAAKAAAGPQ